MNPPFTLVLISYRKNRHNHRLRFGAPKRQIRLDWQRALAAFIPGQTFGYIRWTANRYGTQDWRFFVVQAVYNGPLTALPGVRPGGDILLETQGRTRVTRTLQWLDALETEVEDLAVISTAFWRAAHQSLLIGGVPDMPTRLQKRAWNKVQSS